MFEHLLRDVVQSKAEVRASLVFAVADGDANFCFDVDVRFERRRKSDLSGSGIELKKVGVVAVSEVVLELTGGISI